MQLNEEDRQRRGLENRPTTIVSFQEKLEARQQAADSDVCLGLDSDLGQIPDFLKRGKFASESMTSFNMQIMKEVHPYISVIKPNSAFYEARGIEGQKALRTTVKSIKRQYPDIPVILDAKRGDIGNTNKQYAMAVFDEVDADAVTLHPTTGSSYFKDQELILGALEPFLRRKDKGIFILCRTSNPDAGQFQDLPIPLREIPPEYKERYGDLTELGEIMESHTVPLYLVTAYVASRFWNVNGNVSVIAGAIYPEQLGFIRKVVGDMLILVPGIGKQQGDLEGTIRLGKNSNGRGMIINSSSGIIFASDGEDFAMAARDQAMGLRDRIRELKQTA